MRTAGFTMLALVGSAALLFDSQKVAIAAGAGYVSVVESARLAFYRVPGTLLDEQGPIVRNVPKKADGSGEDIYSILDGDFLVSVAGGHAYSGPLPGFYGDEFLTIIRGELTLTDKATGRSQVFRHGDGVLIPMGWDGHWRNTDNFREFVAVSREFLPRRAGKPAPFAPIDPAARLIPMRFESLPRTDAGGGERGRRGSIARGAGSGTQVYQNRFAVELQFAQAPLTYAIDEHRVDELVQVLRGSLVLRPTGLPEEVFQAGERVVVPRAFTGEVLLRGGYEALVVSGVQ